MLKRITIMLDSSSEKKLRNLQADKVKETNQSYSFSKIVNDVIKEGLKK